MPQLIVRNLEAGVVKQLRRRAASEGISMEEAHRRLLRRSLLGDDAGPPADFLAYLRAIPPGESDLPLPPRDFPRPLPF